MTFGALNTFKFILNVFLISTFNGLMTFVALHIYMLTIQFKPGIIVIELRILPVTKAMTLCTIGNASGFKLSVVRILMTLRAIVGKR